MTDIKLEIVKTNKFTKLICKRYLFSKLCHQNKSDLEKCDFEYSLYKCKNGYMCVHHTGFYKDDSIIYFSRDKKVIYDIYYLNFLKNSWFKDIANRMIQEYLNREVK